MTTGVLLAVPGPGEAALAAAWSGARRDLVVTRRCADLAEVLAAAAAGLGRAVVLGDDLPGADGETVAVLREHGVALLVLVPDGAAGEAAQRRWAQRGAHHVARAAETPEALARRVLTAVAAVGGDGTAPGDGVPGTAVPTRATFDGQAGAPVAARGRSVAVWGPVGSAGRTTLAVNLAAELATAGSCSLLVDLDVRGASAAQLLGVLDDAPGLLAAVRAATSGRLDAAALTALAPEVLPGASLLSGSPDPWRRAEVRPAALRRVLDVAAVCADWVVLDLPAGLEEDEGRDTAFLQVLEGVDVLLVVGAGDPVGLQRWVRTWQRLGDLCPATPAVPVVGRVRAAAVGSDPERAVRRTLRRFAGAEDVVLLPEDDAADRAALAGRSLVEVAPRSPLRRAVRALADRLDAHVGSRTAEEGESTHGFDPLLTSG
ncbi:AAA family ATPase [Kineococcus sp. SYSU DK004]|uniref:AAA family ATPase n=1 Tax=Kineococcus sp. SYSU DK004 TaxID=3383125 RepID=UPI003D7CFE7B